MTHEEPTLNKITKHLILELGVNIYDGKELGLLQRAIYYANINDYTEEPQSRSEMAGNEIFCVKATSYFKRKRLVPTDVDDLRRINAIRDWEYHTITDIKFKNQL